jgi:hypothetical protein
MPKPLNVSLLSPSMSISITIHANDKLLITESSLENSTYANIVVHNNEHQQPAQQSAQQQSAQQQSAQRPCEGPCEGPRHSIESTLPPEVNESTLPPEVNILWEDFVDNDINSDLFDFNNSFDQHNKHDNPFSAESLQSELHFFNIIEPEQINNEPVNPAKNGTPSPRASSPVDIRTDVTSLDTSVSVQKDTSVSVQKDTSVSVQKGPLRQKRGRPPKKKVKSIFQEIKRGVTGCSKCRWSRNGCNGIRCKRNVPLNVNKKKKKKSSHNFSNFSNKHKSQNY